MVYFGVYQRHGVWFDLLAINVDKVEYEYWRYGKRETEMPWSAIEWAVRERNEK